MLGLLSSCGLEQIIMVTPANKLKALRGDHSAMSPWITNLHGQRSPPSSAHTRYVRD